MESRTTERFDSWPRAGKYVISDGYIQPVADKGVLYYDLNDIDRQRSLRKPGDNYLVNRLLKLDVNSDQSILDFTNEFGLLGLLYFGYSEPRFIHNTPHENPSNWYCSSNGGSSLFRAPEVANTFKVDEHDLIGHYASKTVKTTMQESVRSFRNAVSNFQDIGNWIASAYSFKQGKRAGLYTLMLNSKYYRDVATKWNEEGNDDELLEIAFGHIALMLSDCVSGFSWRLGLDEGFSWSRRWNFNSLLHAAYFYLALDLTGGCGIGICDKCNTLFVTASPDYPYCSKKCADAAIKAKKRQDPEFRAKESRERVERRQRKKQ